MFENKGDMDMRIFFIIAILSALLVGTLPCIAPAVEANPDARTLVDQAVDHLRGKTSRSQVTMTIHRPDWERKMTLKAWTKGLSDSIFWIMAPPRDQGNGTLKKGSEMWVFNPKINRVIKLPPSMMSQSWQGSDFSNNDIAKSDSIIDEYTHELIGTETREGKTVYVIRSLPKPGAPVVWGMQELKIREDDILLSQEFFDEEKKPVKKLVMEKITEIGGRLYPVKWKMSKADAGDEYTLIDYDSLEFDVDVSDRMFTVSSLKNPPL